MKKYIKVFVALIVAFSFILAACAPTVTTAPQATKAPDKPAAKTPVTLKFIKIADELEAKAFVEIVAAFQKIDGGKWSHVNVEFDSKPFAELFPAIQRAVATGGSGDLFQADGPNVKNFAYNGILKDLTPYFTADELKIWAPQSIAEGSLGTKFYGPPEVQSCQLMWYNKDMTSAAGIDMTNTAGWTYGDKGTGLANWQKLTKDTNGDGTPEVFGFLVGSGPWDYFHRIAPRTNGKPGDPTFEGISKDGLKFVGYFDSPESIAANKWIQDTVVKYKIMSAEPPANALLSGKAATQVYQDLIMGTAKDQFPNFKLGAIEPPYFVTPMCQTGSWHWAVSSKTTHPDEAVAFVKFLASDEGAKYIWKYKFQLPANLNLLNTLDDFKNVAERKLMKDFFLKYGKPRVETPSYTEYNTLFTEWFKSLLAGSDVEKISKDYAKQMEEAAAKYKDWQSK
jgi:multiple sugar transport system substrate-binding protein